MGDGRIEVVSIVDRVYESVRSRILDGSLERGARLRQEALAAELGVSRTPLREALRRLASEGLVELEPNRGARIPDLSRADMLSAYEARLAIEPGAARLAAASRDRDALERMRAAIAASPPGGHAARAVRRQPRLPPRAGRRRPATSTCRGSPASSGRRASAPSSTAGRTRRRRRSRPTPMTTPRSSRPSRRAMPTARSGSCATTSATPSRRSGAPRDGAGSRARQRRRRGAAPPAPGAAPPRRSGSARRRGRWSAPPRRAGADARQRRPARAGDAVGDDRARRPPGRGATGPARATRRPPRSTTAAAAPLTVRHHRLGGRHGARVGHHRAAVRPVGPARGRQGRAVGAGRHDGQPGGHAHRGRRLQVRRRLDRTASRSARRRRTRRRSRRPASTSSTTPTTTPSTSAQSGYTDTRRAVRAGRPAVDRRAEGRHGDRARRRQDRLRRVRAVLLVGAAQRSRRRHGAGGSAPPTAPTSWWSRSTAAPRAPTRSTCRGATRPTWARTAATCGAFARTAIDAGADLVVGSGPHVVRGIEFYKGHLIAYSAGNFVGYGGVFGLSGPTAVSYVLNVAAALRRAVPLGQDDPHAAHRSGHRRARFLGPGDHPGARRSRRPIFRLPGHELQKAARSGLLT